MSEQILNILQEMSEKQSEMHGDIRVINTKLDNAEKERNALRKDVDEIKQPCLHHSDLKKKVERLENAFNESKTKPSSWLVYAFGGLVLIVSLVTSIINIIK